MAIATYHRIRQENNGDFVVVLKMSNDGVPPQEHIMSYYREKFPKYTNEQRTAALLLDGLYSGDRYYPEKYKRLQRHAIEYSRQVFENTGERPYPIHTPIARILYERELLKAEAQGDAPHYSSYEEYGKDVNEKSLKFVNGLVEYINEQERQREPKITARIRINGDRWVQGFKINSRRFGIVYAEQEAQVFKRTRSDLQILVDRIPEAYRAEIVTV